MALELVFNFVFVPGGGPDVDTVEMNLPGGNPELWMEAWQAGDTSVNLHIIRGRVNLAQAQQMITGEASLSDILMTVPGGGVARRRLPDSVSELTVFLEQANAARSEIVTVRVFDKDWRGVE